ncbi:unnamed protein product [Clonostachys chloroleuca]|uniref:Carrier domain-containing protein n=1 Tax=Clonostachys chloroleuca TaxID=1926264 RepID=A0AA35M2D4_9HYPO|nr:unnamed protein product [Clonostachys chloroleuca]
MINSGPSPRGQDGYGPNSSNADSASRGRAEFPIAIVGMSCRFAGGATSPAKLWDLCREGKDGWSPIPEDRFQVEAWYNPDPQVVGRTHVRSGYFLKEDITLFDSAFFKLTGDVASSLDPQVRLLLEGVYEATEDAGIPIENLVGSNTSVFTGTFSKDYYENQSRDPDLLKDSISGNGTAMLSNRISFFYDLRGPSMTIDTGCSASMVALSQACQTIWAGESDLSIVTGANAMLNEDMFIAMSCLGALSKDGRCFAWDSRANGYGRGEGSGVLILKPLHAALASGDRVHAVVRASGTNHDGKTTTFSSPSMEAQIQLIQATYKRANLDITETGYMTGTPVGDPIEAEALARTFGLSRPVDDPILVGSVKTVIGHTEPVSGIAAIIKTCYALRDRVIPANLNYDVPNKKIPLVDWHLKVPTASTPWPKDKMLRASINNFGYGGANAHVILEAAPTTEPLVETNGTTNGQLNGYSDGHHGEEPLENGYTNANTNGHSHPGRSFVYILSAKDSSVAKTMAKTFATHIRESGQLIKASDLAYTLHTRRSKLPWIVAVPAKSLTELSDLYESPALKATNSSLKPAKRIGFVFNGQGAQWHAMGRELIYAYPSFGGQVREASEILRNYGAKWSLYEELLRDEDSTRINEPEISQPSSVALQMCLVDLLKSWGITPTATTSHSSGEIAAAYTVGALSFKEALGVIYLRGQLATELQKVDSVRGSMAAVGLGPEAAEKYLDNLPPGQHVLVACVNSPQSVTLSGDSDALDEVLSRLDKDGIFNRKLKVQLAYHSRHMSLIADKYVTALEAILPGTAKSWDNGVLFSSPVTGKIITSPEVLSPSHWALNLTSPVLFSQAFENMCVGPNGLSVDLIVEIGAHSTLAGPIRQIFKSKGHDIPYVSCLKRPIDAVQTMQELACELLRRGYPISLESVNFPVSTEKSSTFVPDLPTYPWIHNTRYWDESRPSRQFRNRKTPSHELLGSRVTETGDSTNTWRNLFRLSELEWLRDHQVESQVVVPGAAYISMAIEAARALTDQSEQTIHGYRLRDIEIKKALVLPESSPVEVQISLRACNNRELENVGWFEFELNSRHTDSSWTENCTGYVSCEMQNSPKAATTREATPPTTSEFLSQASGEVTDIDVASMFKKLHKMGIQHGPLFQNLTHGRSADGNGIAGFVVAALASAARDYVIHPTTLDSVFQATLCCTSSFEKSTDLMLPRSIRTMFVPKSLKRAAGDSLQAFTKLVSLNKRGQTSNIYVTNTEDEDVPNSPFFQMYGFFCQTVPRDQDNETLEQETLCSKSSWDLDITYSVPAYVKEAMKVPTPESEIEAEKKLTRASVYFIHDTIRELELQPIDTSSWAWHYVLFYEWMKATLVLADSGRLRPGSQTWTKATKGIRQRLYDELDFGNSTSRLLSRVGKNMARFIRGESTPLELMMEGNLLNQYYSENAGSVRLCHHAGVLAELCASKSPGANILEIGGGTGAWSKTVLEAFDARGQREGLGGSLLGRYTFTDISQGFFAAAREKLAPWQDMMEFKPLDISEDPATQGFEAETYDLIVAAQVLHATKNLATTLSHVRKLLKPGGRLLLFESTKGRLDEQVVFGVLPGWWLSEEDERKMSPHVSTRRWDELLRAAGFSGIDFEMDEYEEPDMQSANTIVSTAVSTEAIQVPIAIVHEPSQTPPQAWLSELADRIHKETGIVPSIESLDQLQAHGKICVFTAELEHPFLDGICETSFESLRNLVTNSHGVVWLTSGGLATSENPAFAAAQGFLRTLRLEDTGRRYILLDFEPTGLSGDHPWTSDKIGYITHILQRSFNDDLIRDSSIENEYSVKEGTLQVLRLIPDKLRSQLCSEGDVDVTAELQPFFQPNRPLRWEPASSGVLSDMHFTDKLDIDGPMPSGYVEVAAKAFGLNFRDVLVALGQLEEDFISHEVTGVITRLGPDTKDSGYQVGDRVCCMSGGRYASVSQTHWMTTAKIPDNMSFEWAASIPVAYATAYHSLVHLARVQKNETVLIHAAAGGLGQAAVVLAQHAGAKVLATCSSEAKQDLLASQYGIPLDHIFSSRDPSFAPAIMELTNGKGVDVVLNSLSGALLKATWDCISRFGRFIEVGKIDIEASRRLDMSPFRKCTTFASVDLLQLREYRPALLREALSEGLRICHERAQIPILPISSFPVTQIEDALRLMQAGKHIGKLVLVPGDTDKVKVVSNLKPVSLADEDATYLIVGGVTGIGSAIAEWMISRGAKTLLLVSRHATTHPNAHLLQKRGEASGCNVQLRDCDLSYEDQLLELLAECSRTLPPIRGVVNGAMVLDDTIFERMTYEQWNHAVRPKINSTRNLDKHLPQELSFFILLSSVVGVAGGTSQANYAAGNTYQDAVSRNRSARGLPGVTIDLCAIRKVGYIENRVDEGDKGALNRANKLGVGEVDVSVVLQLLEDAIRHPISSSQENSQIVMGLTGNTMDAMVENLNLIRERRFGTLRLANRRRGLQSTDTGSQGSKSSTAVLANALSSSSITAQEASALLVNAVSAKLSELFSIPLDEIDVSLPLSRYGVDSLVAVELRNWLSSAAKAKVSVFEIVQGASLSEFCKLVAARSEYLSSS